MNGLARTAAILSGLSMILAAGCSDAADQARDHAQQKITKAAEEFDRLASVDADPEDAAAREKFIAISSGVERLTGADPGQQAAASMISAAAQRHAAELDLSTARSLEADHRADRLIVHNLLDLAGRLSGIADSLSGFSGEDQLSDLEQDRLAAAEQLQAFSAALAELDGPISQLTQQNEKDGQHIAALRQQSNELYRQANDAGPLDGFPAYEKAVNRKRAMQKIEKSISDRQGELEFTYQPAHAVAEQRTRGAQSLIAEVEKARAELSAFDASAEQEAQSTRQTVQEFRAQAESRVKEINDDQAGRLNHLYSGAATALEKAATDASAAASRTGSGGPGGGDQGAAARLAVAAAQQALAQAHWSKASGLADQTILLSRLAAAGPAMGDAQAWSTQHDHTKAARDEALTAARQALTAAREALDQINSPGDSTQLDSLRAAIDQLAKMLATPPEQWSASARREQSPAERAAGSAAATERSGFATAEALFAHMKSAANSGMGDPGMVRVFRATSGQGRSLAVLMQQMAEASVGLTAAIKDRFGEAGLADAAQKSGGGMGMPGMGELSLTNVSDSKASISATIMGKSMPVYPLIKFGESWWIDADALARGPMGQGMLMGMQQMMPNMKRVSDEMAGRVRAGEFNTVDEVMAAYQQALMQSMMSGAGMNRTTPPAPPPAEK